MEAGNSSFLDLHLFEDDRHQPFILEGGGPAAILVHGFPGTPAEMRPIANLLNRNGWTVKGILLPGFGSQIGTLISTNYSQWIEAVEDAIVTLRKDHNPILLIGYSMGAAVAINSALQVNADGLILLAPFWQIGSFFQNLLWQLYKRVTRTFQPFRKTSFDDPKIQKYIHDLIPDLDLKSRDVQQSLRDLEVPNRLIEQVEKLGKSAKTLIPKIGIPLLLVQGIDDIRVSTRSSRKLVRGYEGKLRYVEVMAGHDLVKEGSNGWLEVSQAIVDFAHEINYAKWENSS